MTPLAQKVLARAIYKGENTLVGLSVHYTKMLPIIRELLSLVESQREALEYYADPNMVAGKLANEVLTHTDEVLMKLGGE